MRGLSQRGFCGVAALLITASCSDSPVMEEEEEEEEGTPAFAIGTRVWDDTTTTSYFNVVDSLEAGTSVDLAQAIEVSGAAKLFSIGNLGWFAIGGGEEPTISRYALDASGQLSAQETISFQNYGVESLWDTVYVVSPTKAYYPDRDNQQLIVWNPMEMAVTGSIELPQTNRDGYLALYGYTPIVRGDKLLFTVGWFDWNTTDTVLPETGLVVIDTTTDTVERVDVDSRCGGVTTSVEATNGDFYLVSSALAGAAHKLGRLATAPCALRIRADLTTFDPSYHQPLAALGTGAIAGEPVGGGGDRIFLRVLDESAATIPAEPATWDVTGQLAWQWWSWNVVTNMSSKIDALPMSTADVLWFTVGDKVYGTQTNADYSMTTLIDMTAEGGPAPTLTVPGFMHGLARVR